jgi:DNA-binding response OmpR family regulator
VRYLRHHFLPLRIPIVILTGSLRESDRVDCEAMGVEDYQVKPALFSDLVAHVSSLSRFLPAQPDGSG